MYLYKVERLTMNTTQFEQQAGHYDIKNQNLEKLYKQHQKTPHETIGFEEYRELDDNQILVDGERYFVACLEINEWEHEIEHVIDEDIEEDLEYDYVKALQQIYLKKARKITGKDLNDVESRYIVFDKTRLNELTEGDVAEFQYINKDGKTAGGGAFEVEEIQGEEVWLDGDTEEGVIWKPHEGMIAEETKNQELRNFVEIQEVIDGGK